MKSYKKQVGGNHYKKYKIQPVEFIIKKVSEKIDKKKDVKDANTSIPSPH